MIFDNDVDFEVNKDLRLHMRTDDNYEGRNVDFEVHLPHDLVGHTPSGQR